MQKGAKLIRKIKVVLYINSVTAQNRSAALYFPLPGRVPPDALLDPYVFDNLTFCKSLGNIWNRFS